MLQVGQQHLVFSTNVEVILRRGAPAAVHHRILHTCGG